MEKTRSVNRLQEVIALFATICNHPLLQHASIVLFLNKVDVLKRKVRCHHRFKPLSRYFPQFTGDNANVDAVRKFLKHQFVRACCLCVIIGPLWILTEPRLQTRP